MAEPQEVALALVGLMASGLYGYVAFLQARRTADGEGRLALRGFVLWWAGLAALGVITAAMTFAGDLSRFGMIGIRVWIYGLFFLIFAACGGLVHYMLFLYTGRAWVRGVAYGFYVAMAVFLVWLVEAHAPHIAIAHEGQPDAGEVAFHLHDEPAAWTGPALSLGLILPLIVSAIAYGVLFFRTHDRTARYRIAMVSTGFILWFAYSLIGTVFRIVADVAEQGFVGQLLGQILGVLAAMLTMWAYRPPMVLQRRFGLRDLAHPQHGPAT